jgi:hypothetical protein
MLIPIIHINQRAGHGQTQAGGEGNLYNEDVYSVPRKADSDFLSCSVDDSLWRAKEARAANEVFNV